MPGEISRPHEGPKGEKWDDARAAMDDLATPDAVEQPPDGYRQTLLDEILAERLRQVANERWSLEHDDSHHDGSLASAAACYAAGTKIYVERRYRDSVRFETVWPWENPPTPTEKHMGERSGLIIAAALLMAELERLGRAK